MQIFWGFLFIGGSIHNVVGYWILFFFLEHAKYIFLRVSIIRLEANVMPIDGGKVIFTEFTICLPLARAIFIIFKNFLLV